MNFLQSLDKITKNAKTISDNKIYAKNNHPYDYTYKDDFEEGGKLGPVQGSPMDKALYGEVRRSHKFESWRKRIGSNPSEDEVLEVERVVKKALDVKIGCQIEYKKLNAVDKRNIYIYTK